MQSPQSSTPAPRRHLGRIAASLALAAITFSLYWPVRTHDFINFDDPDYVSANPMVQAGLTLDSIRWAFTSAHSSNWHPLTWLSHMLDVRLFGLHAGAHHLVNVFFHAVNAALLFLLLKRMTGALWRSGVVAALFALHPLHVESVAWVAERKDVLSTFFGLLTIGVYARYAAGKSTFYYGLALVCFALGLMSKPMLVTWPFVLLLLDFWPLRRLAWEDRSRRWRRLRVLAVEKLPFLALTVGSSVVTVVVQRGSGATVPFEVLGLASRLAQMLVSYLRYLGKTFWPDGLAVFYPYTPASWDSALTLCSLALLAAITVLVIFQWRQRPFLLTGWFWFLGTLVPVIGLVQVGRQSIADRYTYLPHIGLFVAVVWLAAELFERAKLPRTLRWVAATGVLAVCGALTAQQISHWRSTATLARHTASVTSGNYIAHTQLAAALVLDGKLDEALAECQKALQTRPDYAEAHNTLAHIHVRQGRLEDAIAGFRHAARCDPTFPDAFHGLADVHFKLGNFAEAEQASREAVRLWPLHLGALYTLAASLHHQGKLDEAIATYRRLNELKPGLSSVHRGLGNALVTQGRLNDAISEFQTVLRLSPTNAETHTALGAVLALQGKFPEATRHLTQALRLQPDDPQAHYQMALALDTQRKSAEAAGHYTAVLRLKPDLAEALNNLAWIRAANPDAQLRDGAEAVRLAERACELTQFKEPFFIGTLAAAYAEAGRFEEAVSAATKARALARATGLKEVADKNEELMELFKARKPYREPAGSPKGPDAEKQ